MTEFLIGKDLEDKFIDVIWNAKEYIFLVSPNVKINRYLKNILKRVRYKTNIHVLLVFGNSLKSKKGSLSVEDFNFFKSFNNIKILYNKNLMVKHYSNEHEGLLTSLNMCRESKEEELDYGVYFSKNSKNRDKLFEETNCSTNKLIYDTSDVIFLKRTELNPLIIGGGERFNSLIQFDISDNFFSGKDYERKKINEFNLILTKKRLKHIEIEV